ncbi:MAG: hypothetical protein M3O06_06445 [Pseudomonadota bacterium]|nr:hypothetical protein [Pseudomonadota bacterium]
MARLKVFQILNHYTPRADLDAGFEVLDNSANERPDWFEYWPIRRHLLSDTLDEDAFYGFLSPKFKHKTNLSAAQVRDFIDAAGATAEVVLFSPSIHNSAYYLNVFEHGEAEHPGLAGVAARLFERLGQPLRLEQFISDSRNTVHSNYFIAKPRFWRAWLRITESLFAIAEDSNDPLGRELTTPTTYRGRRDVQMKIFVMERIATWLLVTDPSFVICVRDPFAAPRRLYKLPVAIVCDALKIAFVTQGRGQYKDTFYLMRNLKGWLNPQIRIGDRLGWRRVRPALRALQAYWQD